MQHFKIVQPRPSLSGHGRSNRLHLSNNILNLPIHTSQVVHDIRRRACSVVVAGPEAVKPGGTEGREVEVAVSETVPVGFVDPESTGTGSVTIADVD